MKGTSTEVRPPRARRQAFSLIEVVIVVVIVGIVAAIAVPRLSRGVGGSAESALAGNVAALRKAIEHYRAEHGVYPNCVELGGNKTTTAFQLTQYTDAAGNYSPTRTATHTFGPYLRQIPPLAVTSRRDRTKINTVDGGGVAWIYDPATGNIRPNTDPVATDSAGRPFSQY